MSNVSECIESGETGWRMSGKCIESGETGWRMLVQARQVVLCTNNIFYSLHSLNSPNSANSLNLCKSRQICLSRMYRVRGKWLANVGRMYRVRGKCLANVGRMYQVRPIFQNGHFGEYSNSPKLANFWRVLKFDKFAGEWPLLSFNTFFKFHLK